MADLLDIVDVFLGISLLNSSPRIFDGHLADLEAGEVGEGAIHGTIGRNVILTLA